MSTGCSFYTAIAAYYEVTHIALAVCVTLLLQSNAHNLEKESKCEVTNFK